MSSIIAFNDYLISHLDKLRGCTHRCTRDDAAVFCYGTGFYNGDVESVLGFVEGVKSSIIQ